ncbi:outer membrane protein transport protein [Jannaschia sp. KMU-145]|uniref:outer membrane protein transport protein n=1 Tax=Jannaschia halovivens TaxID=3388667 RepID=UPI00396B14AF
MNRFALAAAATIAATAAAQAGGIDRSGQPIGIIFEEGTHAELSFGAISPDVTSTFVGGNTSDATRSYLQVGMGYKEQLTDALSYAITYDQPYGADIGYVDGPFAGGFATIDSHALTVLGRYQFGNGFSAHGGLRIQKLEGALASIGQLNAESDWAAGYVIGGAYERPDIALRVALTYSSSITNDFTGTETSGAVGLNAPTAFSVDLPESVNLDFQTGVAPKTLVFGSIRWVGWEGVNLTTATGTYVNFDEDTITYNIGVGRQLTENFAASISVGYEGGDGTGTTLGPTSGFRSVALGGSYTMDNVEISGGIRYIDIGDATASAANVPFQDNDAVAVGMKIAYKF